MANYTIDTTFRGAQAIPNISTIVNQLAFTGHVPTGVVPTLQVFLNIQHTFNDDLDVSLTNPDGTSVVLFTDVGSGNEGFFITLSDAALTDIGTAFNPKIDGAVSGTFNLMDAALLSSLASGDWTGSWTLSITDDLGGDDGSLLSWGIRATYEYSGTVNGTASVDSLRGSDVADAIYGFNGNDVLQGFSGNDFLFGDSEDDQLFGGSGNDKLDGGIGDDSLFGDDDVDHLIGGVGNDKLDGGNSNDLIVGGLGKDVLIGGLGADRFDFNNVKESLRGPVRDIVYFSHAEQDELDLRGIDASTQAGGNQAFHFIGKSGFSGDAGELRYAGKLLQGDVNGDGRADFEIKIVGSLTAADLIL